VRQSVHAMAHLASEAVRIGPGVYIQQWTLERTIGSLGEEVKQPSNPYANLANRGIRRSQVNALYAMFPDLGDAGVQLPRGAIALEGGYVLLRARDDSPRVLEGAYAYALRDFMLKEMGALSSDWVPACTRWARLRLPNQQVARALWKEGKSPRTGRRSRNVKVTFILCNTLRISLTCAPRFCTRELHGLLKCSFISGAIIQELCTHMRWYLCGLHPTTDC
jgi:hypothetical protein